jgi:hypothetical protein
MPGSSTLLIAAVKRSKVPFFVAGGVLVVWALASAALGTRRSSFPGKSAGLAAYLTATVALVLTTMVLAVATAGRSRRHRGIRPTATCATIVSPPAPISRLRTCASSASRGRCR